jgi:putative FmdB family regulatory protein
MPTYEYACRACRHEFEAFHAMSAPQVKRCPKCGKQRVKRKVSAGGGVIFKGSGFYVTDYARSRQESATPAADACGKPGEAKPKIGAEPAARKVHAAKRELEAASKSSKSGNARPKA